MTVPYHDRTIYLRTRTSDHCVYQEVLINDDYRFDLGFEPRTIVDIGAKIGLSAVYYAHLYPSASIVAVEPEISNFTMLEKNVAGLRVNCIQAAVAGHTGEVAISDSAWDKWACRISNKGQKVRAVTLDDLCVGPSDLLKVDVEGSEKEIFGSASLNRVKAVVVETHERFVPGCHEVVRNALWAFKVTTRCNMLFAVR